MFADVSLSSRDAKTVAGSPSRSWGHLRQEAGPAMSVDASQARKRFDRLRDPSTVLCRLEMTGARYRFSVSVREVLSQVTFPSLAALVVL